MKHLVIILMALHLCAARASDGFIIAGQSNGVGEGTHNQPYIGNDLLFANDYTIQPLADPTDSNSGQVDSISSDSAFGSVWPWVATGVDTHTGSTLMFVPCAAAGTSITQWQPSGSHTNRSSLYGSMVWRGLQAGTNGPLKCVLFWQWETDAINGMSQAVYASNLCYFADSVFADLSIPLMICTPQSATGISTEARAEIAAAIASVVGTHHIIQGPDLSDLVTDDSYHLQSDAKLQTAGTRWASNVVASFYQPRSAAVRR